MCPINPAKILYNRIDVRSNDTDLHVAAARGRNGEALSTKEHKIMTGSEEVGIVIDLPPLSKGLV